MATILPLSSASALRQYGAWAEDEWIYGNNGREAIATKRLRWTSPAVAIQHEQPITLTYFADATVSANRMNELAHLRDRERAALDVLEAMVLAAINGTGYLGLPHPGAEISQDMIQLVGGWVDKGGHPEGWAQEIATTVGAAIDRLNAWQTMLKHVGAAPDSSNPTWGLSVAIKPIEPREDA